MSKEWLKFFAKCPRKICSDDSPGYWEHSNCGGTLEINKYAEMRCFDCCKKYKIWKWSFDCGRHGDYENPDYFKLMDIFSELSTIPELRKNEYRQYRKTLRTTIDDECPMD